VRFETYQDATDGWRWRLIGGNNRIVAASSEAFHDQRAALANARLTARWLHLALEDFDAVPTRVEDESTTDPIDITE
jgi:uncharacterized protein YegP (UPF0339 family)